MKKSILERCVCFRTLAIAGLLVPALGSSGCESRRLERIAGSGQVMELTVKGHKVAAELAIDFDAREKGLMHRAELGADRGMLFIWSDRGDTKSAERRKFWMRNTSIPLSIAFIDDEGKILEIDDMRPYDERGVLSKDEVRFALEVNQGWYDRNGVKVGDVFDDFRKNINGNGIEAR